MPAVDPKVVAWVAAHLTPFEAQLRLMFRRACGSPSELDDLVQEVYYRVLKQESLEHIREPRAFVVQTAKNILVDRSRRAASVPIHSVADVDVLPLEDAHPSTERVVEGRAQLEWVLRMVARLPERCQQVFRARKIFGMSQAEAASSLSLSENVVEKETMRGMTLIAGMVAEADSAGDQQDAPPAAAGGKTR
jgi:RNA polymerase sigma-70 factor (ECF subfamily)